MASALLKEVKAVATYVKRSQIVDAVSRLWAAVATEEDPQGRRIGTLLAKVGAERGGGRRRDGGLKARTTE